MTRRNALKLCCLLQSNELRFAEDEFLLCHLGFQRLQPFLKVSGRSCDGLPEGPMVRVGHQPCGRTAGEGEAGIGSKQDRLKTRPLEGGAFLCRINTSESIAGAGFEPATSGL